MACASCGRRKFSTITMMCDSCTLMYKTNPPAGRDLTDFNTMIQKARAALVMSDNEASRKQKLEDEYDARIRGTFRTQQVIVAPKSGIIKQLFIKII